MNLYTNECFRLLKHPRLGSFVNMEHCFKKKTLLEDRLDVPQAIGIMCFDTMMGENDIQKKKKNFRKCLSGWVVGSVHE